MTRAPFAIWTRRPVTVAGQAVEITLLNEIRAAVVEKSVIEGRV